MLYRIEKHHAKNCPCAVSNERKQGALDWFTATTDGIHIELQQRDGKGCKRHGAFGRWLRMICNNPSCPAVLLVNLEEVERAISATVRKERKNA